MKAWMLAVAVVGCLVTGAGLAEEPQSAPEVSYGADLSIQSQYVSRGAVISNEPVLQTEGWVSWKGFTFDLWNTVDLTDDNAAPLRLTETDWALSYALGLEPVELEVGYIYYTFPNWHVEDTQELFATAGLDWVVSPELTVYWDVDEVGGIYANLALSYSTDIGWRMSGGDAALAVSAAAGYGDSNYIAGCFDHSGNSLVDLVVSTALSLPLSEHASIVPSVCYMQVIDDDLRACTEKSEALYGGVNLVVEY